MEGYRAFVNDQAVDPDAFTHHCQDDPFPGGLTYRIHVMDAETVGCLRRQYPDGVYVHLPREDQSSVLDFIVLTIGLRLVKAGKQRFESGLCVFANNITRMEVKADEVIVSGDGSPSHSSSAIR